MLKLFRFILIASRKRRGLVIRFTLRILRLIRDIEKDEAYRYSDKLDELDLVSGYVSSHDYYNVIEEKYSVCEHTRDFLDSAIEDLEFAY